MNKTIRQDLKQEIRGIGVKAYKAEPPHRHRRVFQGRQGIHRIEGEKRDRHDFHWAVLNDSLNDRRPCVDSVEMGKLGQGRRFEFEWLPFRRDTNRNWGEEGQ